MDVQLCMCVCLDQSGKYTNKEFKKNSLFVILEPFNSLTKTLWFKAKADLLPGSSNYSL